jgi:acyl-CoA thioesterase-1
MGQDESGFKTLTPPLLEPNPSSAVPVLQGSRARMALTYLALGDSYTIGESVEPHERWPVQLAQRLNDGGFAMESPDILAQTGWTTDELDHAMDLRSFTTKFDLITLLIGVNNQYRGRCVTEFRQQMDKLLERCLQLSKTGSPGIWVLSIPDWGCTPFAEGRNRELIRQEINDFNESKRERCQMANVPWVEITDLTREAAYASELTATDGLHPSALMYSRWVDRLCPLVEQHLGG